ncbi:UNVERIFIED_CONTAM: hypothetical protein Sangu_1025600 [Sesamum angustifolium]|uniref:RNase H type-1 domain-containing protein n=1 Tax=Sesamum angustifolium TaxID=2727405 RepID=A0AAW2NYU4_9LAMI
MEFSIRFEFKASNNKAKYEAVVVDMRMAHEVGARQLVSHLDYQLIFKQVEGTYEAKEESMVQYLQQRIICVLAHIEDNSPNLLDSCSFCTEALSCLFCEDENIEVIKGIQISRFVPCISNLLFADDTLVFVRLLLELCRRYPTFYAGIEAASGQKEDLAKSSMVLSSNIPATDYGLLGVALGVDIVPKHDKYLGLPAVGGRSKKEMFYGIWIKVWNHIQGWNSKFLSQGSGGLGFQQFAAFNDALLASQAWRIIQHLESLVGRLYRAKHFHHLDFFTARLGSRPFLTWRSILGTLGLVTAGARWRVGNRARSLLGSISTGSTRGHNLPAPAIRHSQNQLRRSCVRVKCFTGSRVIARNHEGSCMAWRLRRFNHSVEPTLAECLAAREAISFAIQEGWQDVILKGDCRIVINRLNSCAADNSYIGAIVEDVRCLMRVVHNCRAEFVPRELNLMTSTR